MQAVANSEPLDVAIYTASGLGLAIYNKAYVTETNVQLSKYR